MDVKARFKDKLSNLLFLQMNKERVEKVFNTKLETNEEVYMPVATEDIVHKVKNNEDVDNIPVAFFIEGMSYVLGTDEKFKYNDIYEKIIFSVPKASEFIKGRIASYVKEKKYEEAYIILKGLSKVEKTEEIYNKLIMLADKLRILNKEYVEEELEIIDKAKLIEGYAMPYLYEALIKKDKEDFYGALFGINNYIAKGGVETPEISDLKNSLKIVNDYDEGKKLVYDEPQKALDLLVPLLSELGDNAEIYYHIAVAYRILENSPKAIHYLEKSMEIDSSYPEVFNELGINYACLQDFESAIVYLRKVFEVTRSIEVCTNLIMCYINIGDYKQAKSHLEIAKKINNEDEIVKQLNNILKDA
ncbi:capsular biosynthesis protein [Clostridium botulinum]|uniref:Capsular biosynthesis protein n=1 Tax=Clostridium botulinum C/D str. DC5 TaxID=1443128 RepID=A0A0A0IE62_CLOBO|nr:tetratricopeptide repeat protein [Clostridium botulinum]KEI06364.1 capsular biosynthesis protein [Clostridium botulinum C/D str. BKT75002]KEI09183.1 capsular biosynthesis protein [Clostridium botulinum C/D str. BKT2873]KGM99232.1 capsular biosynthesis protein [Clostridium botulinum C/D str. DC5]KOC55073.1 capsular biosynthesis protein [Clostridium botulinum]KOC56098.1 capsular biosynthesis protein [Clostridium botulinum]